jgi:hypothetical protein
VLSGGSKRGPLQGLCPEPVFPLGLAWLGDGFGQSVASGRVHRKLATKER